MTVIVYLKKYINWSKNIDVLIQLNGKISSKKNWQFVEESDWNEFSC